MTAVDRPTGSAATTDRRAAVRPMAATVLIATTGVLPIFLVGAIGVQIRRDLGFGETGLGQAIAMSQILAAVCSIAFGRTAERLGPVASMRLAGGLSAISMLAVAAGARSLTSLTVLLIGGGVANAMSQPATNLYISRVIPAHRRGLAFAIKQSSIPMSTLLGGLAVPALALTVGWQWAFVAGAALAVAGGLVVREVPGIVGAGTPGRRDQPIAVLALIGMGTGLGALAAASLGAFSTSSLTKSGFEEGTAGLLAAGGSLIVICVRLWLGNRADRTDLARFGTVAALMSVGAVGFATMAWMQPAPLLAGGALAFAFGWGWPGLSNLSIARVNPNGPAAASGVTQTGIYLGVAAGPITFGWLAEHYSYGAAYLLAAGSAVAAATCITVARRRVVPVGPAKVDTPLT